MALSGNLWKGSMGKVVTSHAFVSGFWRGAKEEAREGDMGGGRAFARVSDPVISPPAPGNRLGACARALGIDRAQPAKEHPTAC